MQQKNFTAARDELLHILEQTDRGGETCVLLCDVYRELREPTVAMEYGATAVHHLPDSPAAHLAYAKAIGTQLAVDAQSLTGMLSAMQRLSLFKAELNRVIELDPGDTEARTTLVLTNMAPRPWGDLDHAIELSQQISTIDRSLGQQLLAACLHRKGQTVQALELLKAAMAASPDDLSFYNTLADIQAEQKQFAEATNSYVAARRGAKDAVYYRALYSQARMQIENRLNVEQAIELLDEFLAAEPASEGLFSAANACWRRGTALEQLGRKSEARRAYEDSLRRDPGFDPAIKALRQLGK